jgi:hypothetical protein
MRNVSEIEVENPGGKIPFEIKYFMTVQLGL